MSVVVPVYDSPAIEELTSRIEGVLSARGGDYEIILVDDASRDPAMWPALRKLAETRANVRAVQLSRNFGQQAATLCGLRESRGDVVVTLDDDLQHDPADIPLLLAHAGRDIVIGQFATREHSLPRRIGSRVKRMFDRLILGAPRDVQFTSFRLLSRTVVDGMLSIRTPHPFLPALMLHVSRDLVGVPVTHGKRSAGRSGYTLRKLVRHFSNLLISNSSLLLRAVAYAGASLAVVSFILAAWAIERRLVNHVHAQGWTSLFAALLLIGGLLLFSVGLIGEYLIRIVETTEAKPTYIVRRRTG